MRGLKMVTLENQSSRITFESRRIKNAEMRDRETKARAIQWHWDCKILAFKQARHNAKHDD